MEFLNLKILLSTFIISSSLLIANQDEFIDEQEGQLSDLFISDSHPNAENENLLLFDKLDQFKGTFQAHQSGKRPCCKSHIPHCNLGVRGFTTMDPSNWYTIITPSYPSVVPLSLNGDRGFKKGSIKLTDTGLTIKESGNYSVTFLAILNNPSITDAFFFPVFLIKNGVFDPNDPNLSGNGLTLLPQEVNNVNQATILKNVRAGTTLSLVISNGVGAPAVPVKVVAWEISAFKIPCKN